MKHNYLVIYEQAEDGSITAYAPELQPGAVVSTGRDYEETRRMISRPSVSILKKCTQAVSPFQSLQSATSYWR
ncbi:MAG: type II toxin-antitoxin system HicB family antitoxin [Silvibacterium sp.]|nr:type II toxin-antitoxin system HicB family antitoxin [Silvibacterium sp.]